MILVKDGDWYKIEESLTSKIKIEGHVTHLEVAKDLEKIFVVENVKHLIFKGEKL